MAQRIAERVVDAVTQPASAVTVGFASFVAGASAYFKLLTPIVGFFASLLGVILTITIIISTWRKSRDESSRRRLEREGQSLINEIKREKLKKLRED